MFGKNIQEKTVKKQVYSSSSSNPALEKFGLDFDKYTDVELRNRNVNSAKEISTSLAGSKMYSFGSLLKGNSNETFALELARAQVEQNFILMRQNEEIIRLLKAISNNKYVTNLLPFCYQRYDKLL